MMLSQPIYRHICSWSPTDMSISRLWHTYIFLMEYIGVSSCIVISELSRVYRMKSVQHLLVQLCIMMLLQPTYRHICSYTLLKYYCICFLIWAWTMLGRVPDLLWSWQHSHTLTLSGSWYLHTEVFISYKVVYHNSHNNSYIKYISFSAVTSPYSATFEDYSGGSTISEMVPLSQPQTERE